MTIQKAPSHLSAASRSWWNAIAAEFELESHNFRLLTLAAEAWDAGQRARKTLDKEGMFYRNAAGEPRSHPAAAIARDSRIAFARLLRELDLDGYPEPDTRPPRIRSRT